MNYAFISQRSMSNGFIYIVDAHFIDKIEENKSWTQVPVVLVVEEAGVPGENHRPWVNNWSTLPLAATIRLHPFCNLQSRFGVLVIGLYELLGNPATYMDNNIYVIFL